MNILNNNESEEVDLMDENTYTDVVDEIEKDLDKILFSKIKRKIN